MFSGSVWFPLSLLYDGLLLGYFSVNSHNVLRFVMALVQLWDFFGILA